MRILYHHRTKALDGQAVHVRALIHAFRRLGNQVLEVAMVHHGDEGAPPARGGKHFSFINLLPRFTVEILEHAYGSVGARRIISAARCFKPHFIYERYALANLAGVNAREKLGIPLFLEVNSPMVYEMGKMGKLVFKTWAKKVENEIFRKVDRIFVVSGVLKRMIVEDGAPADKIIVQHNGVDLSLFPGKEEKERIKAELGLKGKKVVGFSGFLRKWHRIDLALEALASLIRWHYPEMQLLVVGEGPGVKYMRQRSVNLGFGKHITVTGSIRPEEVPKFVTAFDYAIIPAVNSYASPLKLFEYMAAGVPIVAPDQENVREVVKNGHSALLFEPGNSLDFEECLKRLVENRELAERIGENARKRIVEGGFTWEENAKRIIGIYEGMHRKAG